MSYVEYAGAALEFMGRIRFIDEADEDLVTIKKEFEETMNSKHPSWIHTFKKDKQNGMWYVEEAHVDGEPVYGVYSY